jgi:hypothetical protein
MTEQELPGRREIDLDLASASHEILKHKPTVSEGESSLSLSDDDAGVVVQHGVRCTLRFMYSCDFASASLLFGVSDPQNCPVLHVNEPSKHLYFFPPQVSQL